MPRPTFAYNTFMGKLVRLPLALIPRTATARIVCGPLRGKKWIVGAGNHGYWLGTYEQEKQNWLHDNVRENDVFYDLGAHVGYYTLLASLLVGKKGVVYAFEPNPRNLVFLRRHITLNTVENAIVKESAVADRDGMMTFNFDVSSFMGHIDAKADFKVDVVSLDSCLEKGEIKRPDCMKIDVEGAELSVLKGAGECLSRHHPRIFLSLHSQELLNECAAFLASYGYALTPMDNVPLEQSREILAVAGK
jgi:FkbM family methyltransferase